MIPALFLMLAPAVAFHADVEPILQRRCQMCHRTGEIGPVSLMTYAEVKLLAKAVRQAVETKRMPPWGGVAGGPFANHPELTEAERATIMAWVDAGAKEGNRKDAPPPARWSPGWSMARPGMVLTAPAVFMVPARGEVESQVMILPSYLLEDRWVTAAEIRPGSRSVVHHIVAYVREPGSPWLKDVPRGQYVAWDGAPPKGDILAVYTPGQTPFQAPAGMAKKLPAASDLVMVIHYVAYGQREKDQTSIGLTFASAPPQKRVLTLQVSPANFRIPAAAANYSVVAEAALPCDALLLSLFPHMHRRGKAFQYEVQGASGQMEPLLSVPAYRFNWQMNYVLAEPRLLKKGTQLRVTAWFDNSAANPWNPDPSKEVVSGEHGGGEALAGYFDVAVDPGLVLR